MKKNVKAIIAAISASIMCAVPVAASFASTAATTSLTAQALSDWEIWENTEDVVYNAQHAGFTNDQSKVICYSLVYVISVEPDGRHVAKLEGRYNPVADLELPDKLRVDGSEWEITEILDEACYRQSSVRSLKGGKYLEKIGDRAFAYSGINKLEINSKKIEIGFDAFYDGYLRTVKLPGDAIIKDRAFMWNNYLRTMDFFCNDGDNYNTPVYVGHNALKNCTSLEAFRTPRQRRMLFLYRDSFNNCPNNYNSSGFFYSYND